MPYGAAQASSGLNAGTPTLFQKAAKVGFERVSSLGNVMVQPKKFWPQHMDMAREICLGRQQSCAVLLQQVS